MLTLSWVTDILFEKLKPETGVEFEKHPLQTIPLGMGISWKACLLFDTLSSDLPFDDWL